jgi:predicted RNA-binding protein YlxR (DUF448 family)
MGGLQTCQISGKEAESADMLRFVLSPDGELTPDLGQKLPGESIWLANQRDLVAPLAAKFATPVADLQAGAPESLELRLERLMRQQAHGILGLMRKSGAVVMGFMKVEAALKKGQIVLLFAAHDGAENGRQALAQKARAMDIRLCALFSADELGMAFGRENVIHAGLTDARWLSRIDKETTRLAIFLGDQVSMDRSESE